MRIGANGPNYSISLRGAADLVHEPIFFCQRADIMHIALVIMSPFVPHFFFLQLFYHSVSLMDEEKVKRRGLPFDALCISF